MTSRAGALARPTYRGPMANATYDRKEQFQQIQSGLLDGEQIISVYDAVGTGTGFIGLTDRRVIIQDRSFVGKRYAITSIRTRRSPA